MNPTPTCSSKQLLKISRKLLNDFLIEHLPVNVFLVDTKGYIRWANQQLLNFIYTTLAAVDGRHISDWGDTPWSLVQEVIKTQQETSRDEHYQNKHFTTIRKPIFDDKRNLIGVLGVSIDITDRKIAEDAKDRFLRNIRHDIRTPVSGMIGLVSILQESIQNPELNKYIQALIKTSESLLTLLDRVFEATQFSTGEIPILSRSFSLQKMLDTVYQLHHAKALEKNIALEFNYDPLIPDSLMGDALRIQRIAWELLTNALKYTDRGSILLKARLLKKEKQKIYIELQVQDTGPGIPQDQYEFIFQQFARLTPSWLGLTHGQGLGLFNVKQLISDIGGTIHLDSQIDQGSTFTCLIPLHLPSFEDLEDTVLL